MLKPAEVLALNAHRPWALPQGKWQFYMAWQRAVFLHWPADYDELRKFVHPELEIDLFEGQPWVSMVAFDMVRVRPRNLIPFPPLSNFPELNVRTYLRSGDKTGVYFLSLEAGKRGSAWFSNKVSGLPYRFSRMSRDDRSYHSRNTPQNEHFSIEYTPGAIRAPKQPLDTWLTERYAVFQDSRGQLVEYEVHHEEWPIREIAISRLEYDYPRYRGLLQGPPRAAHYSDGVHVVTWGREVLEGGESERVRE